MQEQYSIFRRGKHKSVHFTIFGARHVRAGHERGPLEHGAEEVGDDIIDDNDKAYDTKGDNVCIRSEIIRGLQDLPGNIKTVLAQDNKVSNQYLGHLELS